MRHWRSRLTAFLIGFSLSLCAVFSYSFIAGLFAAAPRRAAPVAQAGCLPEVYFADPDAILAALKSEDVSVRRDVFRRLFLRPGVATIYYDYERDREYPERAAEARVRYVNLDDDAEPEALLTFVRFAQPVALVLQRDACGWQLRGALSAWLRYEDYPYRDWLELPELVKAGTHEIMLRESTGDATSYVRKVRVLKLLHGALAQVAEFNEEEIKPLADYRGADWNAVRARAMTRYTVVRAAGDDAAQLHLYTTGEVVKYTGSAPIYTYLLETDGAWHALARHWRTRPATRLKLLATGTQSLSWDAARQLFVEVEAVRAAERVNL